MTRTILVAVLFFSTFIGQAAFAQQSWVQIEAQPTLAGAEERVRAYAGVFPNVNGFALSSGWYAVALGPFEPEEAQRMVVVLIGERMIPSDSYIADGGNYVRQFWPLGGTAVATESAPVVDPVLEQLAAADPALTTLPDESPREARNSEALLTGEERMQLQTALAWFGFYNSAIDGAIGPGTRNSMAAWQEAVAQEGTGVLTSRQRDMLMRSYRDDLASLGLELVRDERAGIEVQIPTAMVALDKYEPPFAHFSEKDGSGVRVLLISQRGDEATLFGLYDIMQTLEIVPLEGARERNKTSFTLTGQSGSVHSYTQAALVGGLVKGFTLVWKPQDDAKMAKVLAAMQATFAPIGDKALDDVAIEQSAEAQAGLLSGLEVRRPDASRTGFYIDAKGTVLTTSEILGSCDRVTLDSGVEADITLQDKALGLAVLTPRAPLAPSGFAAFRAGTPRTNAEVAVAGYSYEGALTSPVMTFGTFAEARGLAGEETLSRLVLTTLPGDAGGPVFDTTGSVLGMLLPRASTEGRVLPGDVDFALDAEAIASALSANGLVAAPTEREVSMAAEDLTQLALGMTVLVSCWN